MNILDSVFVYRLSGGNRLSWHGRYHAHGAQEYEIHFFLEGNGSFLCNRTRYPVSSGRLYLSGPREFHSILPETVSVPMTYYAILFSVNASSDSSDAPLHTALNSCLANRQTVLSINTNFRFQFEDLLQMSRSSDVSLQNSARHLLSSFLYRWFGRGELSGSTVSRIGINQIHVEKALSIMQKMVRENSSIEEIAWKIGISEEHFIRVFREEVRMTPYQYFTRLKVEGASGMLMSTDKLIGEISSWFGFENQFHFSRIFKKCTGMSPSEYRKTYLQIADFT